MFRIRDFSRFSRVSVKMLRHYDRLGLLHPARVDPDTRYRYYSAAQLPALNRILSLRELGFSLEEVGALARRDPSARAFAQALEARREAIARQVADDQVRLARLDAALRALAAGAAPPLADVVVRAIAPLRVASRRARVADLEGAVE